MKLTGSLRAVRILYGLELLELCTVCMLQMLATCQSDFMKSTKSTIVHRENYLFELG